LGPPEQFVLPAASNAYNFPSPDPTYTTPPTTAGDDDTTPPVVAVHNGEHDRGTPPHPALPVASNAYNFPSPDPTYTTPATTAGDDDTAPPVGADQLKTMLPETASALMAVSGVAPDRSEPWRKVGQSHPAAAKINAAAIAHSTRRRIPSPSARPTGRYPLRFSGVTRCRGCP
jgi:hypothetical protein